MPVHGDRKKFRRSLGNLCRPPILSSKLLRYLLGSGVSEKFVRLRFLDLRLHFATFCGCLRRQVGGSCVGTRDSMVTRVF